MSSGSARFPYGGYHRIQLEDQVFIQSRQAYAIVLEMTNPDGQYLTNEAVAYSIPGSPTDPRTVINEKESYIFRDGAWEILANFMIVPGKAEITGLDAGDGTIRVTVADQWATGIGGYEIEYRKEGEKDWQTVTLADGQTEAELPEPEAGAACEVRARATVDGINAIFGGPEVFYGEYSDTVTVTVP